MIVLAHADTPVQENALQHVRDAVAGEIEAIVPRTAVLGAQHVLRNHLGYSNTESSALLQSFLSAKRIQWYEEIPEGLVHDALSNVGDANVEGWDGYYAQIAIEEGVNTVLTIDEGFGLFDSFETDVILHPTSLTF